MAESSRRLLSVPEVAERFGVTGQTVRNWIASGRLQAVQLARRGRLRIPPDALRAFEQAARPQHRLDRRRDELDRIVQAIVAAVHPEAVILFGSRARGDAGPDADFDLAIVAPDGTPRRQLAMKAYESLATVGGRSVGVDLVVLTRRVIDAERGAAGSITGAVVRDGVAVYGSPILA